MNINYKPSRQTGYLGLLTLENGEKFWVNEDTGAVEKYSPVLNLANMKRIEEGLPDMAELLNCLEEETYQRLVKAAEALYEAWWRESSGQRFTEDEMRGFTQDYLDAAAEFSGGLPMDSEGAWNDVCNLLNHIRRVNTGFLVERYADE